MEDISNNKQLKTDHPLTFIVILGPVYCRHTDILIESHDGRAGFGINVKCTVWHINTTKA